MVDSTPKTCEEVGCTYAAKYGDTVQRTRRFCARHKMHGMLTYSELVRHDSSEGTNEDSNMFLPALRNSNMSLVVRESNSAHLIGTLVARG